MTADEIIVRLGLVPLPGEGGYYRETYRSATSTAIYFLLTAASPSRLHCLRWDEVYHFYAGDPVEMLRLGDEGEVVIVGSDLSAGQIPQVVVPRGHWQGCRLCPGGRWALLGTMVSPPFEFHDFTAGNADELARQYPAFAEVILALGSGG